MDPSRAGIDLNGRVYRDTFSIDNENSFKYAIYQGLAYLIDVELELNHESASAALSLRYMYPRIARPAGEAFLIILVSESFYVNPPSTF